MQTAPVATMRDLDELALSMPQAEKAVSGDGRPTYSVHGKFFCFHRSRRPDAVDPETGLPAMPDTDPPTTLWLSDHHIWDVAKVQAHIADHAAPVTFFCGGSRNSAKFIHLFDGVFILDVDCDTMTRRIAERVARDPTDFGGKPEERALAIHLHHTREAIPKTGITIDATAPLALVVDEILRRSAENRDPS